MAYMNVTNMANLTGSSNLSGMVSSGTSEMSAASGMSGGSEESETPATFADCLQGLQNQDGSKSAGTSGASGTGGTSGTGVNANTPETAAEIPESEVEETTAAVTPNLSELEEVEGNPLIELFNRILERLRALGENGELADTGALTWEDWRKALGGLFFTYEYGGNDVGNLKEQFDDFVADIIAIFTVYIDYSNGKLEELETFETISAILGARIQSNVGTEGGRAFDQKVWELIIQFLEKLDPTVNWREMQDWQQTQSQWVRWSVLATEGGEQPQNAGVAGGIQEISALLSISYVPNVQGETFTKSKTLKVELPESGKADVVSGKEQDSQIIPQSETVSAKQGTVQSVGATESALAQSDTDSVTEFGQHSRQGSEAKTAEFVKNFGNIADADGFKSIPKSIVKDITEYEITRLSDSDHGSVQIKTQEKTQWYSQRQSQPQSAESREFRAFTELRTETPSYTRPVIVKEIDLGEIIQPITAETPEQTIPTEPISGQSIALQVSSSIVENLEKIISQAVGFDQGTDLAQGGGSVQGGSSVQDGGLAQGSGLGQSGGLGQGANLNGTANLFGLNVNAAQGKPDFVLTPQVTEFKVTLNPEHLGKVTVKLVTVQNEGTEVKVAIHITAASDEVRDMLMARAGSVRVMIEHSGVTVERYDVVTEQQAVTASETQQDILDDENGKNQQSDSEREQGENPPDESEVSFSELFQAML